MQFSDQFKVEGRNSLRKTSSGYHSTHKQTNSVSKCNRMSIYSSKCESVPMLLEMSKSTILMTVQKLLYQKRELST